jgi:arsenate reductase
MQSLVLLAAPSGRAENMSAARPRQSPFSTNFGPADEVIHTLSTDVETGANYEPMSNDRDRIIFVCTHNSARSQMAEGMLRAWADDRFEPFSAGTEATSVRPEAIEVMREIGIDISSHASKTLEPFLGQRFEWLVTVCDQAREACPTLPGVARQLHWSVDDPSAIEASESMRLAAFRAARDDLAARIRDFIGR